MNHLVQLLQFSLQMNETNIWFPYLFDDIVTDDIIILILVEVTVVKVQVCPAQLQSEEDLEDRVGVVDVEDVEDGEVGPDLCQGLGRGVLLTDPGARLGRSDQTVAGTD